MWQWSVAFVVAMPFAGPVWTCEAPPPRPQPEPKAIVEAFSKLNVNDVRPFIDDLVARQRVRDLEAIAQSNAPFSWDASAGLVKVFDADKAISYCTSLELDSMNWQAAFLVLDSH